MRITAERALTRGIALLAALLVAAAIVSPSLGAASVKKQIKKVGSKLFIQRTELVKFGPINLAVGASAPVGAWGPFTLTAHCDDADAGAPVLERGRILIDTSEDNSAFESNDDSENDFDAADPPEEWAEETADTPNEQEINGENDLEAHAAAPSGTRITSHGNTVLVNFGGFDCSFAGAIFVIS